MTEEGRFSQEFGSLLNQMERQYRKFMDVRMKPYGVNARAAIFLGYIQHHPGTSQDAIATHCFIDKCTVARCAKRLEESGYIIRRTNAEDRRQNDLFLTPSGEEALAAVRRTQREWNGRISAVMSEEEQDYALSLFERIVRQAALEAKNSESRQSEK